MRKKFKENIIYILFSILLVCVGILFFYQRKILGDSPIYTLGIDEINYIKLSNGFKIEFRLHECRFFPPFVFMQLPFSAMNEIFMTNLISFIFLFYSLIKLAKKYFIPKKIIFLNLLFFLFTFSVSYNFSNFYLYDLPALTTIILFFISIIQKSYFYSLFWFCLSLLFRETAIVFLPIFFYVFSKKKIILATLIILIFYFVPKIIIGGKICVYGIFSNSIEKFSSLLDLIFYIKVYLSFGSLWFLGLAGLFFFKNRNEYIYKVTLLFFLASILGSLFSSIFSGSDVTRMCFLMLPSLFIGTFFILKNINNLPNINYFLMLLLFFGFFLIVGLLPNIIINGNFNSLDDYILSNYVIVIISAILQLILSAYLIFKFFCKSN